MKLPRNYVDEIIAHAREDAPNECCGILAGNDGTATQLFRALNAEASPYRYNVDPKDLLRIHRELDATRVSFFLRAIRRDEQRREQPDDQRDRQNQAVTPRGAHAGPLLP